jgi:GNAT superfamily N-acetyltransferase
VLELRDLPADDVATRSQEVVERSAQRRVRFRYEEPDEALALAQAVVESNAPDLRHYDVVDGGQVVGWLVWWHKLDQAEPNDLVLSQPERSPELLPALVGLARADGARFLGVQRIPGEPAREGLAALDGFVPRATNMALSLDGAIGDPGDLDLRAMTPETFGDYLQGSVESYAVELASSGMSEAAAREQAAQQMAELIPAGLDSPGQSFFTAWVGEVPVGTLWISTERPLAFVYDIAVEESQRRRGYGEAIMNAAARWCRERGHPALGLNVFAHNPHARALYDKLGYQVTVDFRSLDLGDPAADQTDARSGGPADGGPDHA